MPAATLTLDVPSTVWVGAISRSHPAARFRILAAIAADGNGVWLAEIVAPDLDAVLDAVADADAVTELEVLQRDADEALVQIATTVPLLPARESGVLLELPFELQDGQATWELTAPRERLPEQLEASYARGA